MGNQVRHSLTFSCEGTLCAATLDPAPAPVGLLVVSGGNEIRIGSHRGMAKLAAEISNASYPVFRYDRRGVGDSGGANEGYANSGPDMRAALATFRAELPHLRAIVALGNCDGATALILHRPEGIAALVLTNPWIIEPILDEPAPAAARAYYAERLRNPQAWLNVLRGRVNMRKAAGSISSAVAQRPTQKLTEHVASALADSDIPTHLLLADSDGTAIAFSDQWATDLFEPARERVSVTHVDSASHSFASSADHAILRGHILATLSRLHQSLKP